jgi:hypothetical protein
MRRFRRDVLPTEESPMRTTRRRTGELEFNIRGRSNFESTDDHILKRIIEGGFGFGEKRGGR